MMRKDLPNRAGAASPMKTSLFKASHAGAFFNSGLERVKKRTRIVHGPN